MLLSSSDIFTRLTYLSFTLIMTEPLRLSKRMSELGLCSRREADEWIARGWVRVDGNIVSELGSKVLPHQHITVERQAVADQAKRVTILINKPIIKIPFRPNPNDKRYDNATDN